MLVFQLCGLISNPGKIFPDIRAKSGEEEVPLKV